MVTSATDLALQRRRAAPFLAGICLLLSAASAAAEPSETILGSFNGQNGAMSVGSLAVDADGNLFGFATRSNNGCGTEFEYGQQQRIRTVVAFACTFTDFGPGLYQAPLTTRFRVFYGTSFGGGPDDYGTLFQTDNKGGSTTLYDFTGGNDGIRPSGPLAIDPAGTIFGTSGQGLKPIDAQGALWQFKDGVLTVLHPFKKDVIKNPSGVSRAADGTLFGTATVPGGGIWRYSNGKFDILHVFNNSTEGFGPDALRLLANGDMFGVLDLGGPFGDGTLYRMRANGRFSILHAFTFGPCAFPFGQVVRDQTGTVYGVSRGTALGCVWSVARDGTFTDLHDFQGGAHDGAQPGSGPVLGQDGALYGVTVAGGANNLGVIYRITP